MRFRSSSSAALPPRATPDTAGAAAASRSVAASRRHCRPFAVVCVRVYVCAGEVTDGSAVQCSAVSRCQSCATGAAVTRQHAVYRT